MIITGSKCFMLRIFYGSDYFPWPNDHENDVDYFLLSNLIIRTMHISMLICKYEDTCTSSNLGCCVCVCACVCLSVCVCVFVGLYAVMLVFVKFLFMKSS